MQIEATIGESADAWIYDEIAADKLTAEKFCDELRRIRAKTLNVHIDSNGGSVDDGLAIYDALLAYPGNVVVHVDGFCGSICPVIAMAGRKILMARDAVMLIHQTSATMSGTFDQLCAGVRMMAKHEAKMVNALSSRSGMTSEAVIKLMRSEKLLSATEALELGFCTEIVPENGFAAAWDFSSRDHEHAKQMAPIDIKYTAVGHYTRQWARVPKQQSTPAFIRISKPALSGTFPQIVGGYEVFKPDSTVSKFDAYLRKYVTSDSGVPAFYPTGGTDALTFGGATASGISYSATSGTVQSALNGLSPISDRGNVTVSGTYNSAGGFTVTFANISALSLDTSGLTAGAPIINQSGTANGGYTQSVFLAVQGALNFTAGSFQLTILGQSITIAYNATLAAVQTALNALTNVTARGGVVVTGAYAPSILRTPANTIAFTIQFTNAAITADASSLTPAGCTITVAITDGGVGRVQTIQFAAPSSFRNVYVSGGHGIASGDTLYIKGDTSYLAGITAYSVIDSNTIQLAASPSNIIGTATTISEVGKRTKQSYQPGVVTARANLVTDFYLPGVSVGISTSADIPAPTYQGDTETLLAAILSGSGTINVEVGNLTQYMGPILSLTTTQVNAADL